MENLIFSKEYSYLKIRPVATAVFAGALVPLAEVSLTAMTNQYHGQTTASTELYTPEEGWQASIALRDSQSYQDPRPNFDTEDAQEEKREALRIMETRLNPKFSL